MYFKKIKKITYPLICFFKNESLSGIFLLVCTIIALIIANSSYASSYDKILHNYITIGYKDFSLSMSLIHWINDGLMAIFFFVVGMEIKREMVVGELKSISKTILPVGAAIGGMLVPAIIYTAFNYNQPTSVGWGIPMATDIAFSLGVISLVGKKAPKGVITFLTALAIVDDLGAILVIAIFYTNQISWTSLLLSLIIVIVLILMNKLKVKYVSIFIILGILLWASLLKSGIHSTISGVLLAMTIPVKEDKAYDKSPMLYRLERILVPWSSFVIIPIFALANAGVAIKLSSFSKMLVEPVGLGILFGLFFGKQIGIFGTSYILIRLKIAKLPSKVTLKHIYAASLLGGIGFTMSIFVTSLSFPGGELLSIAKISIIFASILSSIAGVLVFKAIKLK